MNNILINVCICLKYIEVKGKVSRHTHTKKGLVQICSPLRSIHNNTLIYFQQRTYTRKHILQSDLFTKFHNPAKVVVTS